MVGLETLATTVVAGQATAAHPPELTAVHSRHTSSLDAAMQATHGAPCGCLHHCNQQYARIKEACCNSITGGPGSLRDSACAVKHTLLSCCSSNAASLVWLKLSRWH
jgi:hypothetical protein